MDWRVGLLGGDMGEAPRVRDCARACLLALLVLPTCASVAPGPAAVVNIFLCAVHVLNTSAELIVHVIIRVLCVRIITSGYVIPPPKEKDGVWISPGEG